jgi:hypothetical protein
MNVAPAWLVRTIHEDRMRDLRAAPGSRHRVARLAGRVAAAWRATRAAPATARPEGPARHTARHAGPARAAPVAGTAGGGCA